MTPAGVHVAYVGIAVLGALFFITLTTVQGGQHDGVNEWLAGLLYSASATVDAVLLLHVYANLASHLSASRWASLCAALAATACNATGLVLRGVLCHNLTRGCGVALAGAGSGAGCALAWTVQRTTTQRRGLLRARPEFDLVSALCVAVASLASVVALVVCGKCSALSLVLASAVWLSLTFVSIPSAVSQGSTDLYGGSVVLSHAAMLSLYQTIQSRMLLAAVRMDNAATVTTVSFAIACLMTLATSMTAPWWGRAAELPTLYGTRDKN